MIHSISFLCHTRIFLLGFGLFAWSLLGCTPFPSTDANDVLDYLRNASVGAQLRRLDASSQAFVDQLLSAQAKLHGAQKPILRSPKALWPLNSPKWNDIKTLTAQQNMLTKWLADSSASPAKKPTRANMISSLEKILAKAPAYSQSFKTPEQRTQWLNEVRNTLSFTRTEQECQQIAQLHLNLVSWILNHAKKMTPTGLQFSMPDLTTQAQTQWKQLHTFLEKLPRPTHIPSFRELTKYEATRAEAIKEKQAMRKKGIRDENVLRQYRRLEIQLHYFDRIIEVMRKERDAHNKASQRPPVKR